MKFKESLWNVDVIYYISLELVHSLSIQLLQYSVHFKIDVSMATQQFFVHTMLTNVIFSKLKNVCQLFFGVLLKFINFITKCKVIFLI